MSEALKQFIGKNCLIITVTSALGGGSVVGIVKAVEGTWVTVETKKQTEMVNTDFIMRIREK